jgi:ribosomal protein L22
MCRTRNSVQGNAVVAAILGKLSQELAAVQSSSKQRPGPARKYNETHKAAALQQVLLTTKKAARPIVTYESYVYIRNTAVSSAIHCHERLVK